MSMFTEAVRFIADYLGLRSPACQQYNVYEAVLADCQNWAMQCIVVSVDNQHESDWSLEVHV